MTPDQASQVLEIMGLEDTPEARDHLRVLWPAMTIYADREAQYGGVWQQYGALNNLVRAATKMDRTMSAWWFETKGAPPAFHKDVFDDTIDCINYLAFFMRLAMNGNVVGIPPSRPPQLSEGESLSRCNCGARFGPAELHHPDCNVRVFSHCICDTEVLARHDGHAPNCPRFRGPLG